MQLNFRTKLMSLQFVCNHSNHSVVKTTKLFCSGMHCNIIIIGKTYIWVGGWRTYKACNKLEYHAWGNNIIVQKKKKKRKNLTLYIAPEKTKDEVMTHE